MISKKARSMSSAGHIAKSQSIGNSGQVKYYQSCKAAGLDVKKSTGKQDIAHIDFFVDDASVDVKGLKESHKEGKIILEVLNVQGKGGWCSDSGPEWIAFDFGAFFLHAKTKDLVKVIKAKCDLKDKVKKIGESLYKGYTRRDRKDLMTTVMLNDVIKDCEHWYLPNREWSPPMDLI
ncbi:hypothetical protein N9955_00320 [bacterium]|nr:hypothetical protein [bacterium]